MSDSLHKRLEEAVIALAIWRATEEPAKKGSERARAERAERLIHAALVEDPPSPLGAFHLAEARKVLRPIFDQPEPGGWEHISYMEGCTPPERG